MSTVHVPKCLPGSDSDYRPQARFPMCESPSSRMLCTASMHSTVRVCADESTAAASRAAGLKQAPRRLVCFDRQILTGNNGSLLERRRRAIPPREGGMPAGFYILIQGQGCDLRLHRTRSIGKGLQVSSSVNKSTFFHGCLDLSKITQICDLISKPAHSEGLSSAPSRRYFVDSFFATRQ